MAGGDPTCEAWTAKVGACVPGDRHPYRDPRTQKTPDWLSLTGCEFRLKGNGAAVALRCCTFPRTHHRSTSVPPQSHRNPRLSGTFPHVTKLVVQLENVNPGSNALTSDGSESELLPQSNRRHHRTLPDGPSPKTAPQESARCSAWRAGRVITKPPSQIDFANQDVRRSRFAALG